MRIVKRFYPLLLTLLLLSGGLAQAEQKLLDRVVAIVDEGVILQSDLESRVRTVRSRLRAQGASLPPESVLQERVLDQLLQDQVQLQLAESAGIRVGDTELNQTISNIARRNGMTLDQFEQTLASEGLSYREAREQIRQEMLISRIQQQRVEPRIRVTQREVQNFLASRQGKERNVEEYLIGHILIEVRDSGNDEAVAEAREEASAILEKLRDGADFKQLAVEHSDGTNALEGGVLGWRGQDQLPSLIADVAPDLAVGEPSDVLKSQSGFHIVSVLEKRGGDDQIVQQHKVRHILITPENAASPADAEATIREIRQRIRDGESFAALAREYSDDPVSGAEGGDLGWVSPGEMVPGFENMMTRVEPGQVSEPFRSRFGWHILEVEERRMHDIGDQLETAEARQVLYKRKYDIELRAWLREVREEAFVEVKAPEQEESAS